MGLGQRRGHVEVGHARAQARVEDRRVEPRVCAVQDGIRLDITNQLDDGVLARGINTRRVVAVVFAEPIDDSLRPVRVEVGERDPLEE